MYWWRRSAHLRKRTGLWLERLVLISACRITWSIRKTNFRPNRIFLYSSVRKRKYMPRLDVYLLNTSLRFRQRLRWESHGVLLVTDQLWKNGTVGNTWCICLDNSGCIWVECAKIGRDAILCLRSYVYLMSKPKEHPCAVTGGEDQRVGRNLGRTWLR